MPQPIGSALARGLRASADTVTSIFALVRGLFQKRVPGDAVGGIVGITGIAYQAARAGFDALVSFLALLSINLAVLNLLPIPPLDGGQLMILLAEKIRGRPIPEKAQVFLLMAGVAFVLVLFVVVTFNDIMRYFR